METEWGSEVWTRSWYPWKPVESDGNPWNRMETDGIRWKLVESDGTLCDDDISRVTCFCVWQLSNGGCYAVQRGY